MSFEVGSRRGLKYLISVSIGLLIAANIVQFSPAVVIMGCCHIFLVSYNK